MVPKIKPLTDGQDSFLDFEMLENLDWEQRTNMGKLLMRYLPEKKHSHKHKSQRLYYDYSLAAVYSARQSNEAEIKRLKVSTWKKEVEFFQETWLVN